MKTVSYSVLFGLMLGLAGCGSSGGGSEKEAPQQDSENSQVQFNYDIRSKYLSANGANNQASQRSSSQSFTPSARAISDWPEYNPPSLSSTLDGPFDFSNDTNLWFNIKYTNEVGASSTYLIKLNESIGEDPTAITSADIFFEIAATTENTLILSQDPLTITGPNESGGQIELIPIIQQGMILSDIGFASDNRLSTGGISNTFESPQLTATTIGPFDLSGDNNLWFRILYTDESEETSSYQVKLDSTVGSNPAQTTQNEIYTKVIEAVGDDLIIDQTPLTIKAPIDSTGTLELVADIELGMTLTGLGFAEDNRLSNGEGNGSGEQFSGTLTVYNQVLNEYQYFPWSIYIEQEGFSVLSNSTLTLAPGSYTLSLLVSNLTRQYGGEGVIEVGEDDQVDFSLQLAPIVGSIDADVEDISTYSQVQVQFTLSQLEEIDVPRLGILVNGESEYQFDISKTDSINSFYLDTLESVDYFYLKFYDDIQLLAKSDTFTADVLFDSDETVSVELYPLISEVNFSFINDEEYPSQITLRVPAEIIDELGLIEDISTMVTIVGIETPFQESTLSQLIAVDDWYEGTTAIEISVFENIEFELEFIDNETQGVLGGCSSSWDVSSFSQTLICASKVVGDNVVYTSLKSMVSINTISILGNPVAGVIIKDQYDQTWGITGTSGNTQGYLSYRVLPGEYQLSATLDGEVVVTKSISVQALEAKNITLVINDASDIAYPNTSCRQLILDNTELPSGFYTIDVDGPSESDSEANYDQQVVYCNMDVLDGGWTLVGYHGDNLPWKTVATVSPDASHTLGSGMLADPFWNQLKTTLSEGMMFIDDAGNISTISASTLDSASCVDPISDLDSLVNTDGDSHTLFLTNDPQCDLSDESRSSLILQSDSEGGINLINGGDDIFELWPYSENQSMNFHDGMWIFIK